MTLPHTGGRLLLASDGLWDMVSPKSALHHVRGLPASKAAAELVRVQECVSCTSAGLAVRTCGPLLG